MDTGIHAKHWTRQQAIDYFKANAAKTETDIVNEIDRYIAWQVSGDKRFLEALYGEEIRAANQRMYMMTDGHWWSDRVEIPSETLQRSRLGGVALKRNWIWAGASVSYAAPPLSCNSHR